jgi:feruloyl esterase
VLTATAIDASSETSWEIPDIPFAPTPAALKQHVTVPFCRVSGFIRPNPESNIGFEIWLPSPERWNGKFFGTANGGSAGAIAYGALVDPLSRGYAAMAQDNGHKSHSFYEESWAVESATHAVKTQKLIDFAYRAQHLATVVGKEITEAYYGSKPRRAYYVGCSQGGHHGMMEAERYPQDYDAIVAGSLASDWITTLSSEAWASSAMLRDHRSGALSKLQLTALHAAVIKSCDALDGLADGQIGDPRKCQFDPATLECGRAGSGGQTCLTASQVAAIRKIYAGLPDASSGRPIALPFNRGSEGGWNTTWNDPTYPPSGSYYDFFRLLVKQNPDWNFLALDWNRDVAQAREKFGHILDANDSDLSAFRAHGGKLIMFHGWADPLIPAAESIRVWEGIRHAMGESSAQDFARLFVVPGMGHCGGGPIGHADWLTAAEQWVESGRPPDGRASTYTIVGSGTIGTLARSRPYCPYPQVARYNGSGDINQAQNFVCAVP